MRLLASYLMRGRYQAALAVAACAALSLLLPPLAYLSGAGVGLVTLRHGAREGLLVTLIAAFALGLIAFISLGNPSPGLAFVLVVWLPVGLLAWVLRATHSLACMLMAAGLLGVALVVGMHLFIADPATWWHETLEITVRPALEQSGLMTDAKQMQRWLDEAGRIMTGLMAATMVLSLVFSLFIARWWQALLYNAGGFGREFRALRFNRGMALPALIALAFTLLGEGNSAQIAGELLTVALVLYTLQGLALAHWWVAKVGAHLAWLVALYGLILALPQASMLLALAGLASTWWNFPLGVADNKKQD